jgi:uncharacterized protein (DUF169 family)
MQEALMRELRLMHYPVAITYHFDQASLNGFKSAGEYYQPVKPLTFCQAEIGARMEGVAVLVEPERLGCSNAKYVFGWKGFDDAELKTHAKYASDALPARAIVESKPHLQGRGLLAVGVAPLALCARTPDVVHFSCDTMQAYHLIADWMATRGVHPFTANITANSAACGGNVHSFNTDQANLFLACSGSYNSGKTERGEINVAIPGSQLAPVVERILARTAKSGGASLTRIGDPFPGADICKNCPLIVFTKGKK